MFKISRHIDNGLQSSVQWIVLESEQD